MHGYTAQHPKLFWRAEKSVFCLYIIYTDNQVPRRSSCTLDKALAPKEQYSTRPACKKSLDVPFPHHLYLNKERNSCVATVLSV